MNLDGVWRDGFGLDLSDETATHDIVDGLLEGLALLMGKILELSRQIWVQCQCRAHCGSLMPMPVAVKMPRFNV